MQKPQIPANEGERIQELHNLNILDTPIQETFERITRLTKRVFQVPIVAFSLVDSERQWFKSIQGLEVCETSREVSFCGHTINQDDIFLIHDALRDERFVDNPLVSEEPKIRFYAGTPIRSANGLKIGTLCIIDTCPREFTEEDALLLKDLAALIEAEVLSSKLNVNQLNLIEELKNVKTLSLTDGLTRLWNRPAIENLLQNQIDMATASKKGFGIAMMDIDNFKKVNDTYGHCAGDEVLRIVAKRFLTGYRETDSVGRWGGEEFLAILDFGDQSRMLSIVDRARLAIAAEPIVFQGQELSVTVTIGATYFDGNNACDMLALVSRADKALYQGKLAGKNIVIENSEIQELENRG